MSYNRAEAKRESRWIAVALLLRAAAALAAGSAVIDVVIHDPSGHPVRDVAVELKRAGRVVATGATAEDGHAVLSAPKPGNYEITASKHRFEPLGRPDVALSAAGASLDLTLVPALTHQESIEVHETISPVDQGASSPANCQRPRSRNCPAARPPSPTPCRWFPAWCASPAAACNLRRREHRSALIVNSADVTDPATGQFGLTVPIDSVESAERLPDRRSWRNMAASPPGWCRWKPGAAATSGSGNSTIRSRSSASAAGTCAASRRHSAAELRRAHPPRKLYFSEGFEYEIRKTRGLRAALSRESEAGGGHQFLHPARLGRLRPHLSPPPFTSCSAAAGLREHGLLQPAGDHAGRQHPQLHGHAGGPADPRRRLGRTPFRLPVSMPACGGGETRTLPSLPLAIPGIISRGRRAMPRASVGRRSIPSRRSTRSAPTISSWAPAPRQAPMTAR